MIRKDIYDVIYKERLYQEAKIQEMNWDSSDKTTPLEYVALMRAYLDKATLKYLDVSDKDILLNTIRKVIALGVACAEAHGLPGRKN